MGATGPVGATGPGGSTGASGPQGPAGDITGNSPNYLKAANLYSTGKAGIGVTNPATTLEVVGPNYYGIGALWVRQTVGGGVTGIGYDQANDCGH